MAVNKCRSHASCFEAFFRPCLGKCVYSNKAHLWSRPWAHLLISGGKLQKRLTPLLPHSVVWEFLWMRRQLVWLSGLRVSQASFRKWCSCVAFFSLHSDFAVGCNLFHKLRNSETSHNDITSHLITSLKGNIILCILKDCSDFNANILVAWIQSPSEKVQLFFVFYWIQFSQVTRQWEKLVFSSSSI